MDTPDTQTPGVEPVNAPQEGAPTPEQSQPALTLEAVQEAIASSLQAFAQGPMNSAIAAHTKRLEKRFPAPEAPQEPPPTENGKPLTAEQLALRETQTKLAELQARYDKDRATALEATAQAEVAEFLSGKVADMDVAKAYFMGKLKRADDGTLYHEDGDTVQSWQEFITKELQARPSLRPASGRGGGGGGFGSQQPTQTGGGKMTRDEYKAKMASLEDEGERSKLATRVMQEGFREE